MATLRYIAFISENPEKITDFYNRFLGTKELGRSPHGDIRIFDPECHPVSLSEKSFGVSAKDEKQFPRVRHIAYNALDPERMLQFFNQVLGLREVPTSYVRRQQGLGNRFGGDGFTNLAIHPFYSRADGHEVRFGINHICFLVDNMQATLAEL